MKKSISIIAIVIFLSFSLLNYPVRTHARELPDAQEVVVFIPGLLGTELYQDEEKTDLVWFDLLETSKLDYSHELYPGYPLGWPGSKKFENVPQWKMLGTDKLGEDLNFYGPVHTFFASKPDLYKIEYFSCDWRKSIDDNVMKLRQKIESVISIHGVSRVHLVAHSMGGLLAKKYILNHKYDTKVGKLITLGTPFYGAPFALDTMMKGYQFNGINIVGKGVIKSIPGLYHLLPNKMFFTSNSTS
jgi:pimeloyl-ACP methyl ester carboxylesterase